MPRLKVLVVYEITCHVAGRGAVVPNRRDRGRAANARKAR